MWDLGFGIFVIPARHVLTANQDLSVVRNANVDTADGCADRSFARPERMVQCDDRRGLREAVALYHGESHAPPEFLEVRGQRRRPHDKRPELQAESGMHATVPPPSTRY